MHSYSGPVLAASSRETKRFQISAMRRASSRVSNFAADRLPSSLWATTNPEFWRLFLRRLITLGASTAPAAWRYSQPCGVQSLVAKCSSW